MAFNHQSLNMKVCHTLICCFFLSLQDGNTGLVNAQITVYTGTVGGDVTIECSSSSYGSWMFFCKKQCKQEDILIETTDVRAQRGRYSIEYKGGASRDVTVTITQLTKSDSGLYRCGLGTTWLSRGQYELIVVDALLNEDTFGEKNIYKRIGENIMVECYLSIVLYPEIRKYFCKEECKEEDILVDTTGYKAQTGRYGMTFTVTTSSRGFLYVSITQLTKSDSGRYRCGQTWEGNLALRNYFQEFRIIVTDAPTTSNPKLTLPVFSSSVPSASTAPSSSSGNPTTPYTEATRSGVLTYVVPIVSVIVVISGLVLMIICILRKTKPDDLSSRRNTDGTNMEIALYENCHPVPTCEDSIYQSLDPARKDQDQTYCTLTHKQHS